LIKKKIEKTITIITAIAIAIVVIVIITICGKSVVYGLRFYCI